MVKYSRGGFGVRYGLRNIKKHQHINRLQKAKVQCYFCDCKKVKRIDMGIWKCLKCQVKYAGSAYTL